MAMIAGMQYQVLRDAVLAHPTMAEGLGSLFSNVPDQREFVRTGPHSDKFD
jgi:hypothetical protein